MNVAIIHHHLNRGGVARVIANHLEALQCALTSVQTGRLRVALLFDGQADGWPADLSLRLPSIELELRPVVGLAYDVQAIANPNVLSRELRDTLMDLQFAPADTVLHVHNHNLGKNASLPGALNQLAADGYRLLLQIHDFAEDLRPANYRHLVEAFSEHNVADRLYPQARHIHYAVLNRRDQHVLLDAGIEASQLHFLPNPASALGSLPSRDTARTVLRQRLGIGERMRYVVYPVRGIRRKNLGEMLLHAASYDVSACCGITLAPKNPAALPFYRRWTQFAQDLDLPCQFAAGESDGLTFHENLVAADRILTTSVAEGFGMAFLECWLANRSLIGRNLPGITEDFQTANLQLPELYDTLRVPVDWIDGDMFCSVVGNAYQELLNDYGIPETDPRRTLDVFQVKVHDGCVDFGDLDESMQEVVIRRIHEQRDAREEFCQLNPLLRSVWDEAADRQSVIDRNRDIVETAFSLPASGKRLRSLYETVFASPVDSHIAAPPHGEAILDSFLGLARFRLIRGAE